LAVPPDFLFEDDLLGQGFVSIAGVDEAGRGPLAGPVVAAAVILDPLRLEELQGVDDSKKLSPRKRERLYGVILQACRGWSLGQASEREVDSLNVLQASLLAMRRALDTLNPRPDVALIDGPFPAKGNTPCRPVIGGDGKSLSIAAASVLAKVTRDRLMRDYHLRYPQYGFDRHKGYGTQAHRAALLQWGPCEIHRLTFLKKLTGPIPRGPRMQAVNKKTIGQIGEDLAARHLESLGYEILRRNFSTRAGEIDLIARDKDTLVFVEVKRFRRSQWADGPLANLTPEKRRRVIRAAKGFLARQGRDDFPCRFDVVTVEDTRVEHYPGAFSA
jgi:uncharacterized protein (TIGR00252 family)